MVHRSIFSFAVSFFLCNFFLGTFRHWSGVGVEAIGLGRMLRNWLCLPSGRAVDTPKSLSEEGRMREVRLVVDGCSKKPGSGFIS